MVLKTKLRNLAGKSTAIYATQPLSKCIYCLTIMRTFNWKSIECTGKIILVIQVRAKNMCQLDNNKCPQLAYWDDHRKLAPKTLSRHIKTACC